MRLFTKRVLIVSICICMGMFASCTKNKTDQEIDASSVFSEKYYSFATKNENSNIVSVERIKPMDEIPNEQLFTASDINQIMEKVLGASGDIHEDKVDELVSSYDEYVDGLPTGKTASVTYDSGYISYIVFRNGKVTGIRDASQFPDKKEVYEKALMAIREKYADKKIELKDEFDESAFKIHYNPQKECLFYTFDITGAIEGKWEDELSVYIFTPLVNVNDVEDIEISSTLGY